MGRWMSPDPNNLGAHPSDPQTWNAYAYTRNNPTTLVDPGGQYTCGGSMTTDQCDAFQATLDQAQAVANQIADKYGTDTQQYEDVEAAINSYGQRGVDNGVVINIGPTGGSSAFTYADDSHPVTADDPTGQNIQVTFRGGKDAVLGNPNSDEAIMAVAHEGSHAADAEDWAINGFTNSPRKFQTESRAYGVSSLVGEARGLTMLAGTRNGSTLTFWGISYSEPVNNMSKTGMIKALYRDWANQAFKKNTQGGGQ